LVLHKYLCTDNSLVHTISTIWIIPTNVVKINNVPLDLANNIILIIIDTMNIVTVIYLIACPMFFISFVGHLFVKMKLRPGKDSELDDYYYEFEDQHPDMIRYEKWSKITLVSTTIFVLMIFIAVVL